MVIRGICSRASIDQSATFVAVGALRWDALPPLWLHHDPAKIAGRILHLAYEGRDLICVAQVDEADPAVRAFLRAHKEFGFSIGATNTKGIRAGHIEIVTEASLREISLTDHPAHAACRVEASFGSGIMAGMDDFWAALAMAPQPKPFNVQNLIRYPEQESAQ